VRWLSVVSACLVAILAAAGCSSSSKQASTTTVAPSATIATVPAVTTPVPVGIPVPACALVPADQVKVLLGQAGTGKEADSAVYYKTCKWIAGDSTSPSATTLGIGIIRIGHTQAGFTANVQGLTPVGLNGVGDKATYSTGVGSSGLNVALLVTNKTTVSLSVDVTYKGSGPSDLQAKMVALATGVFNQLGA
jgi:hypothetical protein